MDDTMCKIMGTDAGACQKVKEISVDETILKVEHVPDVN